MNLETFFNHFELFADAPNAVQKLRELILQLAVQGKLVPQNPDDEPASVLLEKIKQEKERLVRDFQKINYPKNNNDNQSWGGVKGLPTAALSPPKCSNITRVLGAVNSVYSINRFA